VTCLGQSVGCAWYAGVCTAPFGGSAPLRVHAYACICRRPSSTSGRVVAGSGDSLSSRALLQEGHHYSSTAQQQYWLGFVMHVCTHTQYSMQCWQQLLHAALFSQHCCLLAWWGLTCVHDSRVCGVAAPLFHVAGWCGSSCCCWVGLQFKRHSTLLHTKSSSASCHACTGCAGCTWLWHIVSCTHAHRRD